MMQVPPPPYQEAIAVWRAEGGPDLFGDHFGDSKSVMFADVVEKAHGVVLYHCVV